MKAHKYWSLGALACTVGCFYTGCRKLMRAHKYFACGSPSISFSFSIVLPSFLTEIHFPSYSTSYRRLLHIATGFLLKHSRFRNLFDCLDCHIITHTFFQDTGSDIFVILFINFVLYQKIQHLRHVHIRL